MRATIKDIARAAGVSPSTVSRVAAGSTRIGAETRERVQRIMKEMNYHPNVLARSLVNRSAKIIGVVIPSSAESALKHPFFPEFLRGAGAEGHRNGYSILLSSAGSPEEERMVLPKLTHGGIADGVILLTSLVNDYAVKLLRRAKSPFVLVGRPSDESGINWVDNDNRKLGEEVTEYLLAKGHRRIAVLGATSTHTVIVDRIAGYTAALERHGLKMDPKLLIESRFNEDTGYELMKWLMETVRPLPTAAVVMDDLLAFGVLKYAGEAGVRIPEDMSVISFNNVPMAEYSRPSLTSVDVCPFDLGQTAMRILLGSFTAPAGSYSRMILPGKIVERESVKAVNLS